MSAEQDPHPDAEPDRQPSVFEGVTADMVSQLALTAITSPEPLSLVAAVGGPALSRGLQFAVQRAQEYRKDRREATAVAAALAAGDQRDELLDRIANDPNVSGLVEDALNAGGNSTYPSRIRALGAALAAGVLADDTDTIDVEQMVIDTLSRLDRPHVRMLARMAQWKDGQPLNVHSWSRPELFTEFASLQSVLTRLVAELVATGVLQVQPDPTASPLEYTLQFSTPQTRETWSVSDFGLACLRRLQLAGLDEDPIVQHA